MNKLERLWKRRDFLYMELRKWRNQEVSTPTGIAYRRRVLATLQGDIDDLELELLGIQMNMGAIKAWRKEWANERRDETVCRWQVVEGGFTDICPKSWPRRRLGKMKLSGGQALREELNYEGRSPKPSPELRRAFFTPR